MRLNDWLLEMPQVQPYLVETQVRGKQVRSLTEERIFFDQSTDGSIGPGKGGSFLIETMVRQFPKYGIELLTRTAAKKILTDETGAGLRGHCQGSRGRGSDQMQGRDLFLRQLHPQ